MLVLSRKRRESIIIGNDITVTVVDIRGDKVRLGIDAPNDVPVHRQEVYDAIQRASPPPPTPDEGQSSETAAAPDEAPPDTPKPPEDQP